MCGYSYQVMTVITKIHGEKPERKHFFDFDPETPTH